MNALNLHDVPIFVNELKHALHNHAEWLRAWHRTLICRQPIPDVYLDREGHHRCKFGQWFYHRAPQPLLDLFDLLTVEETHKDLHERVRKIALHIQNTDESVPFEEYDAHIISDREFTMRLEQLSEKLGQAASLFDPLTGMFNRRALFTILAQERCRAEREKHTTALVMADIDFFKKTNDTYGHPIGDLVLAEVAECFRKYLRPYDFLFRWGGEEFLVCMPNTEVGQAVAVVERVRQRLAAEPLVFEGGHRVQTTMSFGVAELGTNRSIDQSIAEADKALYLAKNGGRNRVETMGKIPVRHEEREDESNRFDSVKQGGSNEQVKTH